MVNSSDPAASPAEQRTLWRPKWLSLPGPEAAADDDLIAQCIELYGTHYGQWGPKGENPGGAIRIPRGKFLDLLSNEAARLSCAFDENRLIGYCVAVRSDFPGRGRVAWVSQLVVHQTYRNARVATRLLYSVWHFSDCYAWGLVTANPFAIRALETATRRPCRSALITKQGPAVLEHMTVHVPYLRAQLVENDEGHPQPRVDTEFFIDHQGIGKMRDMAARGDRPWALGHLAEGEEWLGCTFAEQEPLEDDKRLAELLTGADSIWLQAYEGMTLDERHAWHGNTETEIDLILEKTGTDDDGGAVLDVGCGDGRHVKELAKRGFATTGIDISEHLINKARQSTNSSKNAHFTVGDAREGLPDGPYDLIICLYDVLGSSANAEDDQRILRNVGESLVPGGYLIASVMNDGMTANRLPSDHRPSTTAEFISALEKLPPSATMEQTGAVFDPYLLLSYEGVYYRKEQFQQAGWQLPDELVVRDRRFTSAQVQTLLAVAGLEEIEVRPVQSGHWDRQPALREDHVAAKELLVVARRPRY